jgi:hypothetical protein
VVPQLVKKFPAFYGIRKFITAFTTAFHLFLFRATRILFTLPVPASLSVFLILSSHLHRGFSVQCETSMVNTSWFATAVVLLLNRKRMLKQDVWEKSRFVLSSVAKSVEILGEYSPITRAVLFGIELCR